MVSTNLEAPLHQKQTKPLAAPDQANTRPVPRPSSSSSSAAAAAKRDTARNTRSPLARESVPARLYQAMPNKRQREAKKRFREANPGLCPPPPAPAADGTKKKKSKKSLFKKVKKADAGRGGAGRSKHPLRVPGMRPGEQCFICKSTDHAAKNCPEKSLWDRNKICLHCRERGHSLKNCPEKNDGNLNLKKFCYNCGGSGHSLSKCPLPIENGGTNFASCFVCKQQGHLSKDCPENTHGIYPKGGCCKICGEVTHLARHCPNKRQHDFTSSMDDGMNTKEYYQEDHALRGGDDLEDDFIDEEEPKPTKSKKAKLPSSDSATGNGQKNGNTKAKGKQAPKVVKFFG